MFSVLQPDYEQTRALYPHNEFARGWSDELYESLRQDEKNLLIIDDQMTEAGDSQTLSNLLTKGAHNKNVTVLYLVQNVYNKSKSQRTMSLNTYYNGCSVTSAMPPSFARSHIKCIQAMPGGS